jgi:2'-5' RNA ligase
MSLFVAVQPAHAALEHLEDAIDRIRNDPLARPLYWQPAGRWHVTMAFLGEASEAAALTAAEVLDEIALSITPATIALAGCGAFGRQILWVGVGGAGESDEVAFGAMAHVLQSALRGHGLPIERRPWRPHLTIARTRQADARPAARLLEHYVGPAWPVVELMLVQSHGGPSPAHTLVHRVPVVSRPERPADA